MAADTQDQSRMQNQPHQDCPLLKLSTELRLTICRLAIQHDLDVINSSPDSYDSASRPLRGALALLHTCRTLRVESIDAMVPLAQTSKSALQSEIDLTEIEITAVNMSSTGFVFGTQASRYGHLMCVLLGLALSMKKIDEVCSLLANARDADNKRTAG